MAGMATSAILFSLLLLVGPAATLAHAGELLVEVQSRALVEAAGPQDSLQGGAWLDVDGDGDLDFVLPGDPVKGVHLQWLKNVNKGEKFVAEPLDPNVEGLPDASVSSGGRLCFCCVVWWCFHREDGRSSDGRMSAEVIYYAVATYPHWRT